MICRRLSAASRRTDGFTLPELLVVLLLSSIIAAGMGGVFATQNRAYLQQDLHVAMAENLRMAMSTVTDTLRTTGCGAPPSNLNSWINWTSGFVEDPIVVSDGGSGPDTLSVAACTPPLATVQVRADAATTMLVVNPIIIGTQTSDLFNTAERGLLWIGDGDFALIRSMDGNDLTIDTDPTASGDQGLLRSHPAGSPVSRVDVHTFQIQTDSESGLPSLMLDRHHGTVVTAAEGISDLQLVTVTPGRRFQVTLTGRSERYDPISGALMTRSLVSDITLRN